MGKRQYNSNIKFDTNDISKLIKRSQRLTAQQQTQIRSYQKKKKNLNIGLTIILAALCSIVAICGIMLYSYKTNTGLYPILNEEVNAKQQRTKELDSISVQYPVKAIAGDKIDINRIRITATYKYADTHRLAEVSTIDINDVILSKNIDTPLSVGKNVINIQYKNNTTQLVIDAKPKEPEEPEKTE